MSAPAPEDGTHDDRPAEADAPEEAAPATGPEEADPGPPATDRPGDGGPSPGQRWDGNAAGVAAPADGTTQVGVGVSEAEEALDGRYDERESRNRRVRSDFPGRGGTILDIHGSATTRDVAGRDIHNQTVNNFLAWGEVRARGPIGAGYLARAEQVYVPTSSDAGLYDACREDQVVFLRGRVESGRRSSAVAVLDELTNRERQESRVTVVEGASGLGGLANRLHKGHGHLLDATTAEWIDMVSEAQIAEVQAALGPYGYLIVLIDAPVGRSLPGVTVDHLPPDVRQVLRSHLAVKVAESRTQAVGHHTAPAEEDERSADRLLQAALEVSEEVQEWLDEITGRTGSAEPVPAEAVHLAECVWAWGSQRTTRPRRQDEAGHEQAEDQEPKPDVRLYRELRLSQQARGLLGRGDRDDAPLRQAYVIAAAVLDGLAVSEVADGARQLARLLHEVEHPGETEGRRIFAEPLGRWLSHVAMTAPPPPEPAGRGTPRAVTAARMSSRRLARAVIEVAWLDYDAARLPLLNWLVHLCNGHPDERVRIRCAQALAVIAGHDYAQIRDRVLYLWADSDAPIQHQAAAWLLEAATLDGAVADRVDELLTRWSSSGDQKRRIIAIRAYATAAATMSPAKAIRGVRLSAADVTLRALPELALREMYVLGLHQEVLKELTFWTRAFPPMRERVGRVLVRIARVPRVSDDGQQNAPKTMCFDLLWRLANEPAEVGIDLATLASLWRLACLQPGSRGASWQMLGFWAQSCRDQPGLRDTFNQLISKFEEVADQAELKARLRVYRRRWSTYLGQEDQR